MNKLYSLLFIGISMFAIPASAGQKAYDQAAGILTCNDYACASFPETDAFKLTTPMIDPQTDLDNQFDVGPPEVLHPEMCVCRESEGSGQAVYDSSNNKLWVATIVRKMRNNFPPTSPNPCQMPDPPSAGFVIQDDLNTISVRRYNMDGTADTTWANTYPNLLGCPGILGCPIDDGAEYPVFLAPMGNNWPQTFKGIQPDGSGGIWVFTSVGGDLEARRYIAGGGPGSTFDVLTGAHVFAASQQFSIPQSTTISGFPGAGLGPSPDFAHPPSDKSDVIRALVSGKFYLSGYLLSSSGGAPRELGVWIARLTNTGALDTTFNGTGVATYTWAALGGNSSWQPFQVDSSPNPVRCDFGSADKLICAVMIDHDNNATTTMRLLTYQTVSTTASCTTPALCLNPAFGSAGKQIIAKPSGFLAKIPANTGVAAIDASGSSTATVLIVDRRTVNDNDLWPTRVSSAGLDGVFGHPQIVSILGDTKPVSGPDNSPIGVGGIMFDPNDGGTYLSGRLDGSSTWPNGGGFIMKLDSHGVGVAAFGTGGVEAHGRTFGFAEVPGLPTIPSVTAPADVPSGRPTTSFDLVRGFAIEETIFQQDVEFGPAPMEGFTTIPPGIVNDLCSIVY